MSKILFIFLLCGIFFVGCKMPIEPMPEYQKIKIDKITLNGKPKRDTAGYWWKLRNVHAYFDSEGRLIYNINPNCSKLPYVHSHYFNDSGYVKNEAK